MADEDERSSLQDDDNYDEWTQWWPTPSVPTGVRETTSMLLLEVDTP